MRVEYLPEYSPNDAEKADSDLYATNVRNYMAERSHCEVFDRSVFDKLMYSDALVRQHSLGDYAMQHLITALETKEAMAFSRRHYTGLLGLAQAFKEADKTRSGVVTLEDFQTLFAQDKNQRLPQVVTV